MLSTLGTASTGFEASGLGSDRLFLKPVLTLTATELIGLQSRSARTIKRTGDIVFSLAVLTLGSPLLLALGTLLLSVLAQVLQTLLHWLATD